MCDTALKRLAKIYISHSKCIYQNLAFEEFLFRKHDLTKEGDAMIVWSNKPAVVIGRHQNPWVEVNVPYVREQGIDLVRRHSGGGTVYHDLGNLNISILTSHSDHCRPRNLSFISDSLNKQYEVNIVPNKRDDMELLPGNRKCSGTAARISQGKAYHHLTLLIQADLERLKRALHSPYKNFIESNATQSVRAPAVGFLKQDDENVNVENVRSTIIQAFKEKFELCTVQDVDIESEMMEHEDIVRNYQVLREWKWVFGNTPKFVYNNKISSKTIEKGLEVGSGERFTLF
ncbi:unnamed protein product [Auanema sp. JU1783]|nr:unnamed protein product [Auanema sp. JU1783]